MIWLFLAAFLIIAMAVLYVRFEYRMREVCSYRMALLQRIRECGHADIVAGRQWAWRYRMFDSVSFCRQHWLFWRPLDSFYPNMSFVEGERLTDEEFDARVIEREVERC